jgi:hypothetical protein
MNPCDQNPQKQNAHHYSYFTLQEFNAVSTIFLEYYEEGRYSDEGVAEGESTAGQRKTLKHQFKEHILGDAKYIKSHNGDHKKWSRYTGCLLKALLECDTMKAIEKNRKIKELNNKLNEEISMRDQTIQVRVAEATKFVMNDARASVDDELRERTDRIEGRFKKYQSTIDKYAIENKSLNERLDTAVSREAFEESTSTVLAQKLEIEELRKKLRKRREKDEEKLSDEEQKKNERVATEAKKAKKEIKKKKKELKELLESVNISDDESSSSSDEE